MCVCESLKVCVPPHLVTVVHGRHYLSEEVSCLSLAQSPAFTDVILQLAFAGVLHHDHNLILVLKHCRGKTPSQLVVIRLRHCVFVAQCRKQGEFTNSNLNDSSWYWSGHLCKVFRKGESLWD